MLEVLETQHFGFSVSTVSSLFHNPGKRVSNRNKSILTFIQKKQGGCAYTHPPHINSYNIDYIS